MPIGEPAASERVKEPVVFFNVKEALLALVAVALEVVRLVVFVETTFQVPALTDKVAVGAGPVEPVRLSVIVLWVAVAK